VGNFVGDGIAGLNHIKDLLQKNYSKDERVRQEAPAEVADNIAGWKVGSKIWSFISSYRGQDDETKLRDDLRSMLCK
jgi:hypothetical protein